MRQALTEPAVDAAERVLRLRLAAEARLSSPIGVVSPNVVRM